MGPSQDDKGALWYDDEAGPMVRAYTITGGRTRPVRNGDLDLIAVLVAEPGMPPDDDLDEEHFELLDLCRRGPLSVAELACCST